MSASPSPLDDADPPRVVTFDALTDAACLALKTLEARDKWSADDGALLIIIGDRTIEIYKLSLSDVQQNLRPLAEAVLRNAWDKMPIRNAVLVAPYRLVVELGTSELAPGPLVCWDDVLIVPFDPSGAWDARIALRDGSGIIDQDRVAVWQGAIGNHADLLCADMTAQLYHEVALPLLSAMSTVSGGPRPSTDTGKAMAVKIPPSPWM